MFRRAILILFFIASFVFIFQHRFELAQQLETVKKSDFAWLGVSAIFELVYLLSYGWLLQFVLSITGIKSKITVLTRAFCESLAINTVTPTGGFGGIAYLAFQASKDSTIKEERLKASAAVLLTYVLDYSALAGIVLLACAFLFSHSALKLYEVGTAALLFLLIIAVFIGIALALWSSNLILTLLHLLQRVIAWFNRVLKLKRPIAIRPEPIYSDAQVLINLLQTNRNEISLALILGLFSRLIGVTALWATTLAFGQNIPLPVIVTAYAMGMLFWIVSVTPQGIGIVEGVMIAVLTKFGVPFLTASAITLTYRAIIFWLPFFYGVASLSLRRLQPFDFRAKIAEDVVQFMAIVILGVGILTVVSSIVPSITYRFELLQDTFRMSTLYGARFASAMAGIGLIALSNGIRRRKKVAWWSALALLIIAVISHLLKGLDYEEAVFSVLALILLLSTHRYFVADSDPPSVRQGIFVLLGAIIITLAYGLTGFYLLDNAFSHNFNLLQAALQTFRLFFDFRASTAVAITPYGSYFADSIYSVGTISMLYAGIMLLRPVLQRQSASEAERGRAQAIVEAHGRSSIARFTLFDDKRYFFSSHETVLAYVVSHRIAVVLGDPIGEPKSAQAAISEFTAFCRQRDWIPAFYQTLPDGQKQYEKSGYQAICIGNEAIVPLTPWNLEGPGRKSLRKTYNRLKKRDYQFEVLLPPIAPKIVNQLEEISLEWLALMRGSEKYFSLGRFDRSYLANCPIAIVRSPDRVIMAFANLIAEYQKPEMTADLMRRRADAPNGMMEFLFAAILGYAKAAGYESFSLGLSPLANVGEAPNDRTVEKTLNFAFEHFNTFYNFKGLHSFKDKFDPAWEPRYLNYQNNSDLPAIWVAIISADSGGSFLEEVKSFLHMPLSRRQAGQVGK